MYKLALFDLDGTLTDPKEGITKSVQYALATFNICVSELNELTKFIGPPLRDSFRDYYGFSVDDAEKAVAKYREYFSERGIFENTLYQGNSRIARRVAEKRRLLGGIDFKANGNMPRKSSSISGLAAISS